MIYCIWYPSGGFGHFINAIITLHGKNFVRPANQLKFSRNGDSHLLELVAPKYLHNADNYSFEFDPNFNYSVLVDNGIDNEQTKFTKFFPAASIIKICYSDTTWPIIAKTYIEKAMKTTYSSEFDFITGWNSNNPWAIREKYFLFLRDHHFRNYWKKSALDCNKLYIDEMLDYKILYNSLSSTGIVVNNFYDLWNQWFDSNHRYFHPTLESTKAIKDIENNIDRSLDMFSTEWDQAVLYYFIWVTFGKEIPHNDYANFFLSTGQIRQWLQL